MKANGEVILSTVKQNGYALQHAAAELKVVKTIALATVRQNGCALMKATSELKADKEVVAGAVQ